MHRGWIISPCIGRLIMPCGWCFAPYVWRRLLDCLDITGHHTGRGNIPTMFICQTAGACGIMNIATEWGEMRHEIVQQSGKFDVVKR